MNVMMRYVLVLLCAAVVACGLFKTKRTFKPDEWSNTAAAIFVKQGRVREVRDCGQQTTPDLKAFCELRCDAVKDASLKGYCNLRCDEVPDRDLAAYCKIEKAHRSKYVYDTDCNAIRLQALRLHCGYWIDHLSATAASQPAEQEAPCTPAGQRAPGPREGRCCSGQQKWIGNETYCE